MANFSLLAKLGLDTKAFSKGLDKSRNKVGSFTKSVTGSFRGLVGAFLGFGLAKNILDLGTSAEETASKFRAVFGPAADEMNSKIKELMKTIPATEAELQDITATLATMTQAMGLPAEASNTLSIELTKLGADIASFNNMRPEEVFQKMRSAISGEFEPLKQLGIVINDARLKTMALELGIEKTGATFTAAQKAVLVYNILLEDTVKMQGDAAATADSTANKIKFLIRDLKEIGVTIGEFVIPQVQAFLEGLEMIGNAAKAVGKFFGMDSKINEAGDDFEAMARQILAARGEIDKLNLSNKEFGFEFNAKKAAEDMEKIAAEAERLREAYNKLNESEQELIDTDLNAAKTQDDTSDAREEAREDYEEQRDVINEVVDALGNLSGVIDEVDGKTAKVGVEVTKKEDTRGDFAQDLTGEALRTAANEAGKEAGVHFERLADGTFQKYFDGKKADKFTEGQLQEGLEGQIEKDPESNQLLEQIKTILEGKFVNE